MADDARPSPLPPDQLQQIAQTVMEGMRNDLQALLKATATAPAIPPPNRPPVNFDGLDALQMERLKTELLDKVRAVVQDEVGKLRGEFFEIFDDMDMPLEKGDKRKATREKLEGLFAMHQGSKEFRSELWKSVRAAVIGQITLVILGALAFFGFKSGGSH